MPIGLARSILAKGAAAAAGTTGARAFNDGEGVSSANKASYNIPVNENFANSNRYSIVMWLRINGTAQIDSPGVRVLRFINSGDSAGGSVTLFNGELNFNFYNGQQNPAPSTNNSSGTSVYNTASGFNSNFLDGSWHCVMIGMDPTTVANRKMYIDNVDAQVSTQTATGSSGFDMNGIHNINMGYQAGGALPGDNTSYTAEWERGAEFDFGPIWFYDSYLDFTSSTTRGYFYNASNTDGYVDGGTDGTDGGAPTPELYLYHSATTLVNGGSLSSVTPSKVTIGSGDIVIVPDTEGPGSGDTY